MMKTRKFIAFCILIAIASGCKKDDTEPFDSNDIYVAGITYASNGREVATLWGNGVAQYFNDVSDANSVFVDGQDVYVGGANSNKAMIWKNGIAQQIDQGSIISSVYVSGGKVYATGNITFHRPGLWINGTVQALTTPNNSSAYTSSVFVSGTDVYVCGYMRTQSGSSQPVYWKNGTLNILANAGRATSVYVSGTDVYIAGTVWNGQQGVATIWKNGVATTLMTNDVYYSAANSVFVSNNKVYVAGFEQPEQGGASRGILWQDGVPTVLSNSNNAASVHVFGEDVYVAGSTITTGQEGTDIPTVWKNGKPQLLNKDNRYGWTNSIFVKEK